MDMRAKQTKFKIFMYNSYGEMDISLISFNSLQSQLLFDVLYFKMDQAATGAPYSPTKLPIKVQMNVSTYI